MFSKRAPVYHFPASENNPVRAWGHVEDSLTMDVVAVGKTRLSTRNGGVGRECAENNYATNSNISEPN